MAELHHDSVRGLLPGAALEVLEADEQALVTAHLPGCDDCARDLAEYREALVQLAQALPSHTLDADGAAQLRQRLLARVASERTPAIEPRLAPLARRTRELLASRWSGWAMAAGLAGVLLMHHGVHRPLGAGWIAAGVLGLVAVVLAIHAMAGRRTVARLRAELENREPPSGPSGTI